MFLELETTGTVCPKNKRTEDIYSVQEDGTIVTIISLLNSMNVLTFVSLRMFGI